jgi:hypothetical protein
MGGKSTSHSALLGGQKVSSPSSFNLRSWQGLTELLKVGKESIKDATAYAEFRNLVLEYAQKGGDAELRTKIDAVVASFGRTEQPKEEVTPTVVEVVTEEPALPKSEIVPPPVQASAGLVSPRRLIPRFEASKKSAVIPVVPSSTEITREEIPTPVPVVVPSVIDAPTEVVSEIPSMISHSVEVAPVDIVPEETPASFTSLEEYKVRITEIKREVNARIGNPATLVDTHNDLGKKYMTALLTALKATGAGQSEGIDETMKHLESAYSALMEDTNVPSTPATPVSEVPFRQDTNPVSIPEEVSPLKEEEMTPFVPLAQTLSEIEKKSETSPEPLQETVITEEEPLVSETMHDRVSPVQKEMINPAGKHAIRSTGILIDDVQKRHGVNPVEVTENRSELSSPEITQALHQLLHDWSIFSGSGLFGIGPGGYEHPLYLKLASLSMGEVLAGRWEGSNPKITKVIKEYVDAWRHEQGISYTTNETFEHYLRRVIQRILKRQG